MLAPLDDLVGTVDPLAGPVLECVLDHTVNDGESVTADDAVVGTGGAELAEGTDGHLALALAAADVVQLDCPLATVFLGNRIVDGQVVGPLPVLSAVGLHGCVSLFVADAEGVGHGPDGAVIGLVGEASRVLGVVDGVVQDSFKNRAGKRIYRAYEIV